MPITAAQAEVVGRIRDALKKLGYPVPPGKPGTRGTLGDLAHMAPSIGKFSAKQGPAFLKQVQLTSDPTRRATLVMQALEAEAHRKSTREAMPDVLSALGKGFMAFRNAKSPTDRVTTVVGVLKQINAATSR